MAKKIELTIWNNKEEKVSYDVPRFVIDERVTDFENLCQRYYDRAKAFELSSTTAKKLASFEKALKNANMTMKTLLDELKAENPDIPEKVAMTHIAWNKAVNDEKAFAKSVATRYNDSEPEKVSDSVAIAYTWAMTKLRIELPLTGLANLRSNAVDYAESYWGLETWSKPRAKKFAELKSACIDVLNIAFDTRENTSGIYIKRTAEKWNSRLTDEFVSFCFGKDDVNKVGGIETRHEKDVNATRQLILKYLKLEGCDSIVTKTEKKRKLTAWEV